MSRASVDLDPADTADDSNLRRRIGDGDVAAIAECYRAHAGLVRGYVARFVAHHEVDDVTQAVFFELWRSAARYDPDRSLRAWLLGIARKRAIDQLRKGRTGTATVPLHAAGDVTGVDDRDLAEQRASADAVNIALRRLPAAQAAVLRLAYFDGYTQTEIAALLVIPLGTVKTRSARGLRGLGRILADMESLPARIELTIDNAHSPSAQSMRARASAPPRTFDDPSSPASC